MQHKLEPLQSFEYELIRRDSQLAIKSTCVRCGASTIGSFDGSLKQWECEHDCKKPRQQKITFLRRLLSRLLMLSFVS